MPVYATGPNPQTPSGPVEHDRDCPALGRRCSKCGGQGGWVYAYRGSGLHSDCTRCGGTGYSTQPDERNCQCRYEDWRTDL